ncbi:hypothetical protein [Liquorilactobacillus vini]|uniref:Uncharacterized protein n=1 Tax=Liquorilactobacillus vini DSM 20605 TaxID=1133569 RepID=A0A0R2CGK7_9LACO|nr:hypothetical protein [Liquorilactobacillus vini]KRM89140.1 hypothetical protein FD21_GL000188 [Liquorilactobacillus vini DSM 20605]
MLKNENLQSNTLQKLAERIREDIKFIRSHHVDYGFLNETVNEDLRWLGQIVNDTDLIDRKELGEFYDIFIYQLQYLIDSRPTIHTLERLDDLLDETFKQQLEKRTE